MRRPIRATLAVAALVAHPLAARPLIAQTRERAEALRSIVAAERAFAAMARERGIDSAFYLNIADDGVLFRPELVRGKDWLRDHMRPRGRALLLWDPRWADVAASGDFGYTTGPYELRSGDAARDSVLARGSFVTVWRRDGDARWRFLIDLGSGGAAALETPRDVASPSAAKGMTPVLDATATERLRDSVVAIDRTLGARGAAIEMEARLARLLGDDSRLYRLGAPVTIGRLAPGATDGSTYESRPLGGAVARSGDLAVTYGTWTRGEQRGAYQRIWKRAEDGTWRLAVDVEGR